MVGVREIMLNDKLIATYVWSKVDGVDMPVFNFYHEHHKTYFATIQEQMQTEEIVLELSHNLDQAKKILNRVVKAEGDPFVLRRIKSVIEEFLKG